MRTLNRFIRGSASTAAVAVAMTALPAIAQDRAYRFSIPAQELGSSLRTFSRVTRQQIAFDGSAVRGKRAPALQGEFSAREGVERLLTGSGLNASFGRNGVIVVRSGPAPVRMASLADQPPVSDTPPAPVATPAPAPAETVEEPVQEITVTGSRIARASQTDSPVPIVGVGLEDIQASGATELSEVLLDYPAVTTDSNLTNAVNSINAAGLSTVDLRSLGADRTLTLIDGRRTVSNRLTRNTVSLSTIPTMFVDRVEIITGGASAIYGSDAIAGVVNIITRRKYDGLRLGARVGLSTRGDVPRYNLDALWGTSFADDRVHVVAGVSFEDESGLFGRGRPSTQIPIAYAQAADRNPANQGTLGITNPDFSSTTPGGRFLTSSGAGYFNYDENGNLYRSNDIARYGYNTRGDAHISHPARIAAWRGQGHDRIGRQDRVFRTRPICAGRYLCRSRLPDGVGNDDLRSR